MKAFYKIIPKLKDEENKLLEGSYWKTTFLNKLLGNPLTSIEYIRSLNKLAWTYLSSNTNDEIVEFMIKHEDFKYNVNRYYFSANPSDRAVEFILRNKNFLDPCGIALNPNDKAVDYILREYRTPVLTTELCENSNDRIVDFLLRNTGRLDYKYFSRNSNPKVVKYLLENPHKIDRKYFCLNSSDEAIDYILKNSGEFNLDLFYNNINPRIVDILMERDKENIADFFCIYMNPGIYILDYNEMKKRMHQLKKEIVQKAMNPKRLEKLIMLKQQELIHGGKDPEDYDIETII